MKKSFREKLANDKGFPKVEKLTGGMRERYGPGTMVLPAPSEAEGGTRITPYWRILKAHGEINPKYPGGVRGQRRHLETEGHRVRMKGEQGFVEDFEAHAAQLP